MLDNGDCTLIRTCSGKNVLIDTGEKENVVLEYLLDRRIHKLDFLMISHFDSDHCGNAIEVMKNIKVDNVIISKQAERSKEFEEIVEVIEKRKIRIIQVEAGNTVIIDKDTYFKILWPNNKDIINNNALNNNSIVAKMYYKNFSMLFTGDIEEVAEQKILEQYDNNILQSTVLKVPHHGSKTSSTNDFIESVKPKIALIGVGKNNNFGHPDDSVIECLKKYGSKIYRTDIFGEISLIIDKKGAITVESMM